MFVPAVTLMAAIILLLSLNTNCNFTYGDAKDPYSNQEPTVNDPHLRTEMVFRGLDFPTSMAFLGPDDILVLEKNTGEVQRIINGVMLEKPLLDVNVANAAEGGMLGIAVTKHNEKSNQKIYVFLYFTEASTRDGDDSKNQAPLGNRLYRYELADNKLIDPKLLLNLPASSGWHNGGKVIVGPDNNLYVVIGDLGDNNVTKAQNSIGGVLGTGGILRITQEGKIVGGGLLGKTDPLNKYYAYGIRNSFGMDFDPVTGNLWDTEDGPAFGDEINLVKPGFNSGWDKVQGIWEPIIGLDLQSDFIAGNISLTPDNLVTFDGKGKYSRPEFIWNNTAGLSAIKFLDSDKLGKQYKNDIFVGDVNNGNLYHFELSEDRQQLELNGALDDKIADVTQRA